MNKPPELMPFPGEWGHYENLIYQAFIDSFVKPNIYFQGYRVSAQHRPETRGKGFSFWHTISEAPDRKNRNEEERTPDLRRCERIRWIRWVIDNAENEGFIWWENQRRGKTHVVIWTERYDFAVVLAKRSDYYVLKTAYAEIKSHRQATFKRESRLFWTNQKS